MVLDVLGKSHNLGLFWRLLKCASYLMSSRQGCNKAAYKLLYIRVCVMGLDEASMKFLQDFAWTLRSV